MRFTSLLTLLSLLITASLDNPASAIGVVLTNTMSCGNNPHPQLVRKSTAGVQQTASRFKRSGSLATEIDKYAERVVIQG